MVLVSSSSVNVHNDAHVDLVTCVVSKSVRCVDACVLDELSQLVHPDIVSVFGGVELLSPAAVGSVIVSASLGVEDGASSSGSDNMLEGYG